MSRSDQRYFASESVITSFLAAVVGAGMTLGFGALMVGAVLDLRAFPDAPRSVTVAEAARADPPRGAWVRLADARLDCRFPPRQAFGSSNVYAFVTDATGEPRLLVAVSQPLPSPCEETQGVPFTGVLAASTPGRIVGLDWPGLDWHAWPTRHLTVLWTALGPGDSQAGLWVGPIGVFPGALVLLGALGRLRRQWRARRPPPPRLTGAAFVMPLSTGGSVMGLFGGVLVVVQLVVFGPLFVATRLPDWTVYPVGVLWAAWFFGVLAWIVGAWKQRASDLLLGRDELAVRGGPLDRKRIAFRALSARQIELRRHAPGDADAADAAGERATLLLDGEVVAVCSDAPEERSLAAVVETLRALSAQAKATGKRPRRRASRAPGIVCCDACGAPVAPSAAATVPCAHCGASVTMPADARERLLALGDLAEARARSERLLRRLLRQPGAGRTNLLLAVAVPPLLLGWPLAAIFFDEMYQSRHLFSWHHGVSLFVAALSFTYGLSWLVRAQVVGRAAVRLVTTRFAAVPPEAPGEPASCRHCGGPLPATPAEQLVVLCAYCRSENLLGTNLSPAARREDDQARDLGAELAARLAERRRYRLVSLGSLLLLAVSAATLVPVWRTLRGAARDQAGAEAAPHDVEGGVGPR